MTGNQKRNGVATDRRSNRPPGLLVTDAFCYLAVSRQTSHRNLQETFPHLQLKVGSLEMKFDGGQSGPILSEDRQRRLLQLINALLKRRIGKLSDEIIESHFLIVPEGHMAYPLRCRSNNQIAKRTFSEAVMDGQVPAAVLVLGRRHPLNLYEQVMKPAGCRQSCFHRRIEQRRIPTKNLLCVLQTDILQKLLGRRSSPIRKQPLEVKRAYMHMISHF